ncbi:hypothetical protein LINGRAHAP2_LOCUS31340 [Linum grandiflorum]
MDLSEFEIDLKSKKSTAAVFRYYHYGPHLRGFRTAFRAVEFLAALLLFLWMFTHLPLALQISGQFFRRLATVIESPPFVFLVCNAIIVTLIVKSSRFAPENLSAKNVVDEGLYGEILKNADTSCCQKTISETPLDTNPPPPPPPKAAADFVDKEIIVSPIKSIAPPVAAFKTEDAADSKSDVVFYSSESESDAVNGKIFRRTRSENLQRRRGEEKKKLQRSETEKSRKTVKSIQEREEEEELSDEEFQRAVEEFIAKNLRLRRQETLGVVVQRPRSSVAQLELRSEIVIN